LQNSFLILTALGVGLAASLLPSKASACTSCASETFTAETREWIDTISSVTVHVSTEFNMLRLFMVNTLFEDNILPAMMLMTEQMSVVAMQQVQIFGGFMDAKHQMETQQLFQKLAARANKDYHPSVGMCEFGSTAKSLAASDRRAEYTSVLMAARSQDRALGNAYSAAHGGEGADSMNRVKQFREKYCNPADNNGGLGFLCQHDQKDPITPGEPLGAWDGGQSDGQRMNKDIDFSRTIDQPWTLNVDFTDNIFQKEEEDVMALASNLYGHYVFKRPPGELMEKQSDPVTLNDTQTLYMDVRATIAKQAVAENSFNAITAMKSAGEPGSREYMYSILKELGMSDSASSGTDEILRKIGENPSYYAQMEVLTKKIYQNPDFYTDLIDKPANVDRKGVALQAIGLMQKFDLFKSYLRNEASLSVLLELAVTDLQNEIQEEIENSAPGGKRGTP
jgi:hypothetical protein